MTFEIALVLGLLALLVILFATERLPVDLGAILAVILLWLFGIITPVQAVAGFTSPAILLLTGIFIICAALVQTGVTEAVGRSVQRVMGNEPRKVLFGLTAAVATMSAWMNNTTVTAIFVPPGLGVARRLRVNPSKFLMPIAFASLLGGTCTLIGTSTNVAVSGMLESFGLEPLAMFELTPVGVVIALAGVLYLTFGGALLPDRPTRPLADEYHLREFLSEVVIVPGSPMAGRPLAESGLGTALDLTVLAIHREGSPSLVSPGPEHVLQEGDLLLVQGSAQQIAGVKQTRGIEMRADLHPSDADLTSERVRLVEVIPAPQSDLIGHTLAEVNFRNRFGCTAVGLYRAGETLTSKVGRVRLRLGDVLLVQGRADVIERISHSPDLEVLEDVTHYVLRRRKGAFATAVFAAAIAAGSLGAFSLTLPMAVLLAAVAVVLAGCVPWQDVTRVIYWRMLLLIGGMMAFGTAMTNSGADRYLAARVTDVFGAWGPMGVLAGFFLITTLLTQPMSNAAAAQVILPVALSAARVLEVNPRTFAVTVALAASCSFVTPLEPSCLLVYGPGRYRFRDFIVFGTPLTAVLMLVTMLMVPWLWPLS